MRGLKAQPPAETAMSQGHARSSANEGQLTLREGPVPARRFHLKKREQCGPSVFQSVITVLAAYGTELFVVVAFDALNRRLRTKPHTISVEPKRPEHTRLPQRSGTFPEDRARWKGVSLRVTLPLIDHLALRVRDLRRSPHLLRAGSRAPFGVKVVENSQGPGFAIEGGGDFWIGGRGTPRPLPFMWPSPQPTELPVDKFHRAAVEAGGRDNGAPGLRPHYHAGYYAAFVIDPDGNNVEAVFHGDDR